jgi:hypothetical protein
MVTMARKIWILCCLLLGLVAVACGGANRVALEPSTPPSGGAKASSGAAELVAPPPQAAPVSQPGSAASASRGGPAAESAARQDRAPTPEPSRPQERPGLGTEWGETRESRVHDVTFVRAEAERPFAVAAFHYNDRAGVEAQINFHKDRGGRSRGLEAAGGAVTVSLRDGAGDMLEAIKLGDRTYVIGSAGQRYSIVLQNHTSHRMEAVATVDGLDVISGKDGSLKNRGYVLMPFAILEIDGFRQSRDAVAAFRFGAVSDSYASQMGKGRNVGVIGVALFNERGDTFFSDGELRTRDTASPFPADPRFAPPPPRR